MNYYTPVIYDTNFNCVYIITVQANSLKEACIDVVIQECPHLTTEDISSLFQEGVFVLHGVLDIGSEQPKWQYYNPPSFLNS